jgi:feruloyl esterase
VISIVAVAVLAATPATAQSASASNGGVSSCDALASVALPNTTITSVQTVAAGAFAPPGAAAGGGGGRGAAAAQAYARLPAFCRVAATLAPSTDSDIRIEVWLPASGWNGKFQEVGNGGWAGTIPYPAMAAAVAAGYATASTDTGHRGNNADFAPGHPEKVVDFGYRAIHETAVAAKALIQRNYGSAPRLSYFSGCSQGGRQGITEAQRYPADFDGIVAGAPAWGGLRTHAGRMALNRFVNRSPDAVIPPAKYRFIHTQVLNACDGRDGVKDGVIENPTRCQFDPGVLACRGEDGAECLTPGQVESARAMLSPVKHPRSGEVFLEGHLWPGAELGWATLGGPEPLGNVATALKNIVFQDPNWDPRTFNPGTDLDRALAAPEHRLLASDEANLKPFFDRGGKLLLYHGWADPQVTPQNGVNYYNNVVKAVGQAQAGSSIALFMVPGMLHCQGGPGTDTFDKIGAIEQWVERGQKPARIVASHLTEGKVDRTRPLCPFGQVAKWNGSGSTDDAANFSCVAESMDTSR